MTWHRRDGAAVAPVPLTGALLRARGLRPLTLGALVAGPAALGVILIVGLLGVEIGGADEHDVLLRAAVATSALLTLLAVVAHPLRVAAARRPLLSAAALDADRARPAPPASERRQLSIGPQPVLHRIGVWAALLAVVLLVPAILAASAHDVPLGVRIGAVPVCAAVLLAGIVLAVRQRRGGAARTRWERLERRASLRWCTAVTPTERVPRPGRRRAWMLVLAPIVLGTIAFVAGMRLRQPSRRADPVQWGPAGETAIDVLLAAGGALLALGAIAAATTAIVLLLGRARSDTKALRAAREGAVPEDAAVDAIALDDAPLERVAIAVAVLGWLLAVAGAVPVVAGAMPVLDPTASRVPLLPGVLLLLPAAACLALSLWLAARGARRAHALRTAVLGSARRDPVPWVRPFDSYDRPEQLWRLAPGLSGHWGIGAGD